MSYTYIVCELIIINACSCWLLTACIATFVSIQFACIHACVIYNVIPLDIENVVVVEDIVECEEFVSEVVDVVDGFRSDEVILT